MFRAIFSPNIRSITTVFTASGIIHVWGCRLESWTSWNWVTLSKPEAATAVIELLMMGGKTHETCWAVNKRQDNKLGNRCIWLVIYLNFTVMHGLTKLKLILSLCTLLVRCMNYTAWICNLLLYFYLLRLSFYTLLCKSAGIAQSV